MALAGGALLSCGVPDEGMAPPAARSTAVAEGKPPADRPQGDRPGKLDPAVASVPVKVTIPGATAPIDPVTTIENGELQLPETAKVIAWWAGGAAPGEKTGVISLAGHVNTRTEKTGVFTKLAELRKGDKVSITGYGGKKYTYVVSMAPKNYNKSGLPQHLFDPKTKHQLALITCSGKWDPRTRAYPNNLIVWADPV